MHKSLDKNNLIVQIMQQYVQKGPMLTGTLKSNLSCEGKKKGLPFVAAAMRFF
jgi:hypothetical protein